MTPPAMQTAPAPVSPGQSRDIVAAALDHLARIVLPNGRFIYAHQAGDIDTAHEGYNLLRHCGTVWFMARAASATPGAAKPATIAALARACGYIARKLSPTPWADPARPSLALVGKDAVKLGGLGLALLALAEAQKVPGLAASLSASLAFDPDETLIRLRRYALDEIDGDDFHHKRAFPSGDLLPFRSDYYTGEAIFGLLVTGPAPEDLTRVTTALMRRHYGWAEQSHWMTYAACEAIERGVVPEVLGSTYLTGLIEAILGDPRYRQRRQSTPIACRTEALTRVLLMCQDRPGLLSPDLLARTEAHAAENLTLQLDWYRDGQFWKGDDARKVQIDYIQHNATAFLHWAMLGEG
jgi:hypothetical protein